MHKDKLFKKVKFFEHSALSTENAGVCVWIINVRLTWILPPCFICSYDYVL